MERKKLVQAIRAVIDAATIGQGRSRRWLAKKINLAESTMMRWYEGETDSYALAKLIAIFETAGLSMDRFFGLGAPVETAAQLEGARLAEVEKKLDRYEWIIDQLRRGASVAGEPLVAARSVIPQTEDITAQVGKIAEGTLDRCMPESTPAAREAPRRRKAGG